MDCVFCTLFDSNYLDKGLTLYYSMVKNIPNFRLYVFAFDDKCYEILKKENLPNLIIVPLSDFESKELLKVKRERTHAEYCWTCSPWIIKYVFNHFNEIICTYIDADMKFFASPQAIFDEMKSKNCSIIIVPHRFKNEYEEKVAHDKVGSYCVEFNTFVNDDNGMKALNWWADRCLEWCFYAVPGTTKWYGDQKYLNVFPEQFEGVMICNHYGVGLAPWNIELVKYSHKDNDNIYIRVKGTDEIFPVVLYHFENVSFVTTHLLNASSRTKSKELHNAIYRDYINDLISNREYIENKYNIKLSRAKRVLTNNIFITLYQKYISPIKRIKHLSDLYWVK